MGIQRWFSRPVSRVVLLFLFLGFSLGCVLWVVEYYPTASNQGYAPVQPIPFSHRIHAKKHQIPCLYCHSVAERSRHASIPALNVCMNCHSVVKVESPYIQMVRQAYAEGKPIEWIRVHELPDYVYFPHKRHLAKGIACETCHGQVQDMERVQQKSALTMGWCMECHLGQTTPADVLKRVYPHDEHPKGPVAPVDCNTCHH